MQDIFYHYTSLEKAEAIFGYRRSEWGREGLIPSRRVVPLSANVTLPRKAHDGAVFGLINRVDKGWATHEYHKGRPIFETVLNDISGTERVLLEVTVDDTDDIYIAEHGYHLADDYDGCRDSDPDVLQRVKESYWNSLCPFFDYFAQGRAYTLPEVICFSEIPKERIKPIEKYDSTDLRNIFRQEGGFPALEKRPVRPPDPEILQRVLGL